MFGRSPVSLLGNVCRGTTKSAANLPGKPDAFSSPGIISATEVPGILKLDLLATDFYHDKAYPSYLIYNPYNSAKKISIKPKGAKKIDVYNTVTGKFILRNVSSGLVEIPPQQAAVIVCVPSGGRITYSGNQMLVNGTVIDYRCPPANRLAQ